MNRFLLLIALFLTACEGGAEDSFSYLLDKYGVAGGCLGSYIGGLLVSLTPCVYPMIAITVSVFGANPAEGRRKAMLLSLAFVVGLAAMYTPLGFIAGFTGGLFGEALSNPWVIGSVVVILVTLATPMFGLWELALPSSLQTKLSGVGGVGYIGAFLMGLVAGLLAAPCSGPVTIALLTYVGTSGAPLWGALYFFCYSLGIGTLFFLVGTFALSLPRSGRWMELIKTVFGVVLLVAAAYYASMVFPGYAHTWWELHPLLFIGVGAAIVIGAVVFLHAAFTSAAGKALLFKKLAVLSMVALGVWIAYSGYNTGNELMEWRDDFEVADAEGRAEGRPLLIDFTAEWCGACGHLARETFNDPRVAAEAESKRYVPIRVDSTRQTPTIERYMERYNVQGLPTVIVIGPHGDESARVTEFIPPEEMLELLR